MRRADSAAVCPSFTLRLRPRPPLEVRALLPGEKDGPGLREPPPASPRSLRVPLEPDSVSPRLTCLRPQCPSVRPSILHPSSRTGSCSKCRALGATRHRLAPLNYLHVKTPPSGPKLGCHPRTSLCGIPASNLTGTCGPCRSTHFHLPLSATFPNKYHLVLTSQTLSKPLPDMPWPSLARGCPLSLAQMPAPL